MKRRLNFQITDEEVRELPFELVGDTASDVGIGYTLATGRLFCDFAEFQRWSEALLERPILTHEFADETTWSELRTAFETWMEHNTESRQDEAT